MAKKKHWPYEKSRQVSYSSGRRPKTACAHGGASPEFASRVDEVTCVTCAYEVDHSRWWWGGGEAPPHDMCGYCGERIDLERDDAEQLLCQRCIREWQEFHGDVDPDAALLLELVGRDPTPVDKARAEELLNRKTGASLLPPGRIGRPALLDRIEQVRRLLATVPKVD